MSDIIIRARLTAEGQLELIDPVPSEMERPQEVTLIIRTSETPTNAFGEPLERDADGSEIPLNPLTAAEVREFVGLWANRRDEIGDPAEWVRKLRLSLFANFVLARYD